MMREMPASEFQRWKIIERMEPFGVYGSWLQTGLILSLIANIYRKPGTFAHSAEEFIPETLRAKTVGPTHSPEQIFKVMMLLKKAQDEWLARRKAAMRGANAGDDTGARTV